MSAPPPRAALGRRGILSILLMTLTCVLLAVGGVLVYVHTEIADEQEFGQRVASSLDEPVVRQVLADHTADALISRANGDLLAVRPILATVVEGLVGTQPFRRAAAFGLADTHRQLVAGEGSLIVRVSGTGRAVIAALRSVSPTVAAHTSGDVRPVLTRINRDNSALVILRRVIHASRWGWWLIGAAVLAAIAAFVVAPDRRRTVGHLGAALVAAGLVAVGVVMAGGSAVTGAIARWRQLHADDERAALDALWQALFGDLRTAGLIVAAAGVVLAVLSAGIVQPVGAGARVRELAGRVRVPPAVRRTGLVAAGALVLLLPGAAERVLVLALGAALIYFGLRDVVRAPTPAEARPGRSRSRDGLFAALAIATVLGAAAAAGAAALSVPSIPPPAPPPPPAGCNGSQRLCDERVDQVFWPATHNSYAAADQPGWVFPNQRRPIGRQLADGIRGLTLDVHWGVRDPRTGRVRTDLDADGMEHNKVVAQIGPQGLRAAQRVAGGIGIGDLTGPRELYLCHTLCELGAEPLDAELQVIRRFLDTHPQQVVTIIFEPYVPPGAIEAAMRRTGLLDQAVAFDRTQPLPTLRRLIDTGQRLIVFTEKDGGARPWYMPAFSYIQDTPLGAQRPSELSCARWRGDADSPILMLNHWIDRFPPRVSDNARIGTARFLTNRINRCARDRDMPVAIVAVDFYDRTALLQVAAQRNR
ncbi:MAG: hypothetical protein U0S48_17580 [Solirubrobacteraceae bacterium]